MTTTTYRKNHNLKLTNVSMASSGHAEDKATIYTKYKYILKHFSRVRK